MVPFNFLSLVGRAFYATTYTNQDGFLRIETKGAFMGPPHEYLAAPPMLRLAMDWSNLPSLPTEFEKSLDDFDIGLVIGAHSMSKAFLSPADRHHSPRPHLDYSSLSLAEIRATAVAKYSALSEQALRWTGHRVPPVSLGST